MATPEERKLELERKKQRLAEIRDEKKRREDDKRQQLLQHQQTKGNDAPKLPTDAEMEKILSEVGIASQPKLLTPVKEEKEAGKGGTPAGSSPSRSLFTGASRSLQLIKTDTVQINFAPKEQVAYSKTTQTDSESGDKEFHGTMSTDFWEDEPFGQSAGTPGETPEEVFALDQSPTHHLAGLLPQISLVKPAEVSHRRSTATGGGVDDHQDKKHLVELSEEEKHQIVASHEFQRFFDRSSRIIERALTEEVDIFVDYSRGPEDQERTDTGAKVALNRSFYDERWSKGRCVSCFDYSVQHPELVLASYQNNEDLPHEPDGVVLVWNTKFKKTTPEYVFHCQSRVTSVAFAKFHPNLILGGTYSGQICLWDNRQNKKTPVQKSPLSTAAHTHPIYSLKVVGTQNAHNLISVSTDGKLCAWSMDMLAQPQEALELNWNKNRQVASTCLSFPLNDVNNFVVGSEEGCVYSGCRHGSKAGITEVYEGHFAPITGIDCHTAVGQVDFTQLFLTSSFDWTVKLWSTKETKPIYSFEDHNDYVLDVAWSPTHPALFACVDGSGRLDLWNLNQDTELPAATVYVEGRPALNKIMWLPSGHQLAIGDNDGSVWLYDIHESLANCKPDEWQRLAKTLLDIKQASIEAEELSQALALGQSPSR